MTSTQSALQEADRHIGTVKHVNKPTRLIQLNPLSQCDVLGFSLPSLDYDTFLSEDFDTHKYVHQVISKSDQGDATEIATSLSQLSFSIDSLNKQIREEVNFGQMS
jgi:hypothetical protein